MSVQTFDVNKDKLAIVNISAEAAEHFRKQVDKSKSCGIRISLKEAGCTGYKYVIDETEEMHEGDLTISLDNGVQVYVDSRYIYAIQGAEIDIRQQGLNMNLIIENPNVKDECGCGESFSIENAN